VRIGQRFTHAQAATRRQHAAQLTHGGVLVWHLTERGHQVGRVDAAISVGQRLDISLRGQDLIAAGLDTDGRRCS
jgi:hypothetical protein